MILTHREGSALPVDRVAFFGPNVPRPWDLRPC